MAALEARGDHGTTVLDLDYRPMFWESPQVAHEHIRAAVGLVDVAVGNLEECEVAIGERDPERAAAALLDAGVDLAVVKQGPRASWAPAATSRSWCHPCRWRWSTAWEPATPSVVRSATGSSPAGTSSTCSASPTPRARCVAGRLACADAMPTTAELEEILEGVS